jgi:hypothetical protein
MGFTVSVSLNAAIDVTGPLALAPTGLTPAEHVSLLWTEFRRLLDGEVGGFPALETGTGGATYTINSNVNSKPSRKPGHGSPSNFSTTTRG